MTAQEIADKFKAAFVADSKEVLVSRTVHSPCHLVEATGFIAGVRYGFSVLVEQDLSNLDRNIEIVRLAFARRSAVAKR